ncbi:MAG: enoyl-CoA hydratase/isomerase family protein, partial [Comamonadaceae bacterium]|nr:enoyl-CoA hydratase/isomerase family protein [Comamonadaceae bacterium]
MNEEQTRVVAGIELDWRVAGKGDGRVDGAACWAHVRVRNPGKLGAMSVAMWLQLREVFERIAQQPQLRCVLITGEAGAFCAGGDISEYAQFRFEPQTLAHFHEQQVWGGLEAMLACEVPLIAAIDGPCMGAGLEIASCCDLRIATVRAQFGAPIARLGFPMAPRELALVAHAVGDALARRMLLAAQVLPAQALHDVGFLAQLLPEQEFEAAAQQWVQRLLALAPQAARMHKRSLRVLAQAGQQQALAALLPGAYDYAPSAEHREGIAAFLAKRKPQ